MKGLIEEFIPKFFGLLRTHEIYPEENETAIKTREEFLKIFNALLSEEFTNEIIIEVYSEHFLINNKLIKPESFNVIIFTRLLLRMKKIGIIRIRLNQELTMEEILNFLSYYLKTLRGEIKLEEFKKLDLPSIKFWEKEEIEDYENREYIANLLNFIDIFSKMLVFHRHTFEQIIKKTPIDFLHIRRAVQDFISSLEEIKDRALGFLALGLNEDSEFLHSVLRAIIIERFGAFLNLPLKILEDLVFLSLFSNIGAEIIPKEFLKKQIDEREKAEFLNEISAKSYEILLNIKPITSSTALVMNFALSFSSEENLDSNFYKILKVVKAYESLIQNKPYRACFHPLSAMEIMWKEREKYDKETLESFFSFLTKEPIGSTWISDIGNPLVIFSKNVYKNFKENKWEFTEEKPLKPVPLYEFKLNPVLAFLEGI